MYFQIAIWRENIFLFFGRRSVSPISFPLKDVTLSKKNDALASCNSSMMLIFFYLLLPMSTAITSRMTVISGIGMEFLPIHSIELLQSTMAGNRLRCAIACHARAACRTLDYDPTSHRCRLYEGDLTTGSLVASNLSISIVMTMAFTSTVYAATHNQPCQACADSRDAQCSAGTCQCPPRTYWNGSQCLCQLFLNQPCTRSDACRKDLNLTCMPCYQDTFTRCEGM